MVSEAKVIAFLGTSQPEACRSFYEGGLCLEMFADEPFALIINLKAAKLRIGKVEEFAPLSFTVLGWTVEFDD